MSEPSQAPDPSQYAPGSFGCHEALHVASIAHDFVARHLCEHPAIQQNPEWDAQATRAAQALFDLYQMIGDEHMGADTTVPVPARPASASAASTGTIATPTD